MKLRWLVLVSILMCSLWPAPVAGHGDTLTSALSLEGRGGAPSPRLSPWKGKGEAPEGGWQQETITGDYTTVGYDYEYSLALEAAGGRTSFIMILPIRVGII